MVDCGDFYLASITECLGTKALVADAMRAIIGPHLLRQIAQDTLAMALNDIITVGATPISVHAYWATGGSDWFADAERARDLVDGWRAACDRSGVAWGGGETPGAGRRRRVRPHRPGGLLRRAGPAEVAAHARRDGSLTAMRSCCWRRAAFTRMASRSRASWPSGLPDGYRTRLADGTLYGEALLAPTVLYSPVTEALAAAGIVPHYCANVTGHGWRKLMRHPGDFAYRLHSAAAGAAGARFHPRTGGHR